MLKRPSIDTRSKLHVHATHDTLRALSSFRRHPSSPDKVKGGSHTLAYNPTSTPPRMLCMLSLLISVVLSLSTCTGGKQRKKQSGRSGVKGETMKRSLVSGSVNMYGIKCLVSTDLRIQEALHSRDSPDDIMMIIQPSPECPECIHR
jgi:hypothetical protein